MNYNLKNPTYHNTLTDCDGTSYVLVTTPNNPVVNLFHFVNEVQNLKFLEAVFYIDHEVVHRRW